MPRAKRTAAAPPTEQPPAKTARSGNASPVVATPSEDSSTPEPQEEPEAPPPNKNNGPSLIPEGYTYINASTMISKEAFKRCKDLLEDLELRDPQNYNIYINKYWFNYAQLNLIDRELSTVNTKTVQKKWVEAFQVIESLTMFNYVGSLTWDNKSFPYSDHILIPMLLLTHYRAYGALFIKILQKLKEQNILDTQHFPNLETVLRLASKWCRNLSIRNPNRYHIVLEGIGKRLFGNEEYRSADAKAAREELEKKRVDEWINNTLDEEERKEVLADLEEKKKDEERESKDLIIPERYMNKMYNSEEWKKIMEEVKANPEEQAELKKKEEEERARLWYETDEAKEDSKDKQFVLSRIWKEYKDFIRDNGCPYMDLPHSLFAPITQNWYLSDWDPEWLKEFSTDKET
ncbi:hypothetical protein C8Q75DRAFT_802578 [Abortiporus biennis]|nr:hypothetical protein C8Q75DRAFT_802578 [Abortiporus biennis]